MHRWLPQHPGRWVMPSLVVVMTAIFALSVLNVNDRVAATTDFTEAVQQSRVESLVDQCRESNRRHDKTIETLDAVIAKLPRGPKRREANANRRGTVALINALAPKRHCVARAHRLAALR